MKKRTYKCCICGKKYYGYGNNPEPVKKHGKCCDKCNAEKVLQVRINEIMETW